MRYLLWHSLISLMVWAALYFGRSAPPRLNMYVALCGMLVWLIPFPLFHLPVSEAVAGSTPATVYHFLVVGGENAAGAVPEAAQPLASEAVAFAPPLIGLLFALATLVGGLLFIRDLVHQRRTLAALAKKAVRLRLPLAGAGVAVYQIPGSGAMTTGLWRPRVWLGAEHRGQPEFRALLVHELTHVRRRDNAYLLVGHLVARLFWWNPLVALLSERMRFYLELACDQSCCSRFEKQAYREALAATMLKVARLPQSRPHLAVAWGTGERHNLTRIKMIDGSFHMKKGYCSLLAFLILVNAALIAAPGRLGLTAPTALALPTVAGLGSPEPEVAQEDGIARVGQPGIKPPIFIRKVAPQYPIEGLNQKIEGYVILEAVLQHDGNVGDIKVLRSLENAKYGFEQEALAAVRQWQFIPGERDDVPTDVRMTLKIDFALDPEMKPLRVAVTNWRNLNPGLEGEVQMPQVLSHDKTFFGKDPSRTQVEIPITVQIAASGDLIESQLNPEAIAAFGNQDAIRTRIDAFVSHLKFEPARVDDVPVDTEIIFNVPLSL